MIRPEIQSLIERGHIQIDEVSSLSCSREEATALITALAPGALAMRIERTLAHLQPKAGTPLQDLATFLSEGCRRLQQEPPNMDALSDQEVSAAITQRLSILPPPVNPAIANSYKEALYILATNAAARLEAGV